MSDPEKPSDLARLEARLKEAESRRPPEDTRSERSKGLSFAFRIGTELVAGIAVGVGIGWALDRWLGTKPWLMIAFFVLGAAAGMMNVYRAVAGLGGQVGYKRSGSADRDSDRGDRDDGKKAG